MKSGSKITRALFWLLVLLALFSACSRNQTGGPLGFSPDFGDPDSPLRRVPEWAVMILEAAGIVVILGGAGVATVNFLYRIAQESFSLARYHR